MLFSRIFSLWIAYYESLSCPVVEATEDMQILYISVFMDDIAAVGTADDIRKGTRNCRRMEIEKKVICGLKKTKYMVINTRKKPEEVIEERVKKGIVQETDIYKYLGMILNKSGNFKDHIPEFNIKCEVINREIRAIGAIDQVGKEEI